MTATCITTSSNVLLDQGKVEMHFDHGRRELNGVFFSYVEDPDILMVRTGKPGQAGVVCIMLCRLSNEHSGAITPKTSKKFTFEF